MKPNKQFQNLPKRFWALVRIVGEGCGYTGRGAQRVKVSTRDEVTQALIKRSLSPNCLDTAISADKPTWDILERYLRYRAKVLNEFVEPRLMDAIKAKRHFQKLRKTLKPQCPLPMNKQKGKKRAPAYFTGIINMLVEANAKGYDCDYDPRALTAISKNGMPIRTLARRVDGAFPSAVNPLAVWEIKEYYYTTTFGSRVADGVYETLLDGMELEELAENEKIDVLHYLFVDAHYTWWECGRSYLCRIVDMMHMGYVDEVIFGEEVLTRLPLVVKTWIRKLEDG